MKSAHDWCASYRTLGWKVLPLMSPTDRHPKQEGWQIADSLEPDEVEKYNIPALCIQTGPVSNLLVLDADNVEALQELRALLAAEGVEEWSIPIQKTRRGAHLFFAWPKDWPDTGGFHHGKLMPGVDIRGWHAQVNAEPADGKCWVQGPFAPPALPDSIRDRLIKGGGRRDDRDPTDLKLSDEVLEAASVAIAKFEAEGENDGSSVLMKRTAHAVLGLHVYDEDDFVKVMARWNSKRGEEAFDEDRLRQAHRDCMSRKRGIDAKEIYRPIDVNDEYHAARRLLFYLGRDSELVADAGALWSYNHNVGIWEPTEGAELRNTVGWRLSKHPAFTITGKATRLVLQQRSIEAIAQRALEEASSGRSFFADASVGVATLDGFLTLDAGRVVVREHSPEHRARTLLSVPWIPDARHARWESFLEQCFAGCEDAAARIRILQLFAGAALFGLATKYEKCLVLQGEGANGKSVWRAVVGSLFPARARSSVSPSAWGREVSRMRLRHSLWNSVGELPAGKVIAGDVFKDIVSGEVISAKDPYYPEIEFRPRAAHVFSTNPLPPMDDHSQGLWRRMLLVQFPNNFEGRADVTLTERLMHEAQGAVLAWAARGAELLVAANGFESEGQALELVSEWRESTDQVLEFMLARTLNRPGGVITDDAVPDWMLAQTVYNDYRMWALGAGHRNVYTMKRFCMQLVTHGVKKRRHNGGMQYHIAQRR